MYRNGRCSGSVLRRSLHRGANDLRRHQWACAVVNGGQLRLRRQRVQPRQYRLCPARATRHDRFQLFQIRTKSGDLLHQIFPCDDYKAVDLFTGGQCAR